MSLAAALPHESFLELAPVVDAADMGLILIDADGRVVLWNAWIARASQIPAGRALGATMAELFPELSERRFVHAIREALDRGMSSVLSRSVTRFPFPLQRPSRSGECLEAMDQAVTIKPIQRGGRRRLCLIQVSDISGAVRRERMLRNQAQEAQRLAAELERRAEELGRSNQELQEFAYVASHDLREPLRTVASFSQLLSQRCAERLEGDARRWLQFIVDGAKRMDRQILGLLEYSRVGSRGKELVPTECQAALSAALANLGRAIRESDAQVVSEALPRVIGDDTQLIQLFQNLLENALKFRGSEAPRIRISAESAGGRWRLSVSDNGIGIDKSYADRIFRMFQRLHCDSEYPGSGIGLAVCRKIVERHGGELWFESTPGAGSMFFFTLSRIPGGEKA